MILSRRDFVSLLGGSIAAIGLQAASADKREATEIAITMDDPKPDPVLDIPGLEINRRILTALEHAGIRAALFVTGKRVDNPDGKALLAEWDSRGHLIGNHSYSHLNYNSTEVTFERFTADLIKNEPLIRGFRHFTRHFRFPMLKEGNTAEKRDGFREFLRQRHYGVGHVTVDASDWYIDQRMRARLASDPRADAAPYRDYYVAHIRDRARYYRQLARDLFGHDIRHTLLVHHGLLNALYLPDIMQGLREDGWKWVDASDAFRDRVFKRTPQIVPAGESLVWALAMESGRFEGKLRYPGEDGEYEKEKMDALGL